MPKTREVVSMLIDFGLMPKLVGFVYLTYILISFYEQRYSANLTDLCRETAKKYDTSATVVESDIRTLILSAWELSSNDGLREVFNDCNTAEPPTVISFIRAMFLCVQFLSEDDDAMPTPSV